MRQDAPDVLDHQREQAELDRRECNGTSPLRTVRRVRSDFHVTDSKRCGFLTRKRRCCAASSARTRASSSPTPNGLVR